MEWRGEVMIMNRALNLGTNVRNLNVRKIFYASNMEKEKLDTK
jgi:hypothetical protein